LSADKDYLQLFNYQLLQGSIQLEKSGTAVLTEECAQRIFGKENPIGKVLKTSLRKDVVVTGIIRNAPIKAPIHSMPYWIIRSIRLELI
jgi:hypothetical protein